jgi:hypothetical protein
MHQWQGNFNFVLQYNTYITQQLITQEFNGQDFLIVIWIDSIILTLASFENKITPASKIAVFWAVAPCSLIGY